jgi:gliding motility-associated lipoprotein GldD
MMGIKLVISVSIIMILGCSETPTPKPHGFPRIELPIAQYENWESNCVFSFRKSTSTTIEISNEDSCFFNLIYPSLNATLHFSYIPVNGHLKGLIDQEYKLREKHNQFSSSVQEKIFQDPSKKVNALLFNITGTKAATPLQFFITDSTNHFFRGVLYFNTSPNNDSLSTVIDFIRADVDTLIESFSWK